MIIRHDLQMVYIHVPKCAGKQLRKIIRTGATEKNSIELWNYSYNQILNRYVDMAHLPLCDLRVMKEFKYLDMYTVVTCVRNPYMRLSSAANEYYRQKTKEHELIVNNGEITREMKYKYYKKLANKHSQLDPRFIHSLPIHRFTHYGDEPKVDYLLKCESLDKDVRVIAKKLHWPEDMKNAISKHIGKDLPKEAKIKLDKKEIMLANSIYKEDFKLFGYNQLNNTKTKDGRSAQAGYINNIHTKQSVIWHWGPYAQKENTIKEATRKNND